MTINNRSSRLNSSSYLIASLFIYVGQCTNFSDYNNCVFSLNDSNGVTSTYNLSRFHLTDNVYVVKQDDYDLTERLYKFNICGQIATSIWNDNNYIIPQCRNQSLAQHGPCIDWYTNGTCKDRYNATKNHLIPSAVQYTRTPVCHWSGAELDGYNGLPDYNVSLIDSSDSASGIRYTMLNGDLCSKYSKGAFFTNRELNIELVCPDSNRNYFNPDKEVNISEDVIQYPLCVYTITYETALACPSECISTGESSEDDIDIDEPTYSVCNGNGVCISDPNYGQVRCICDDGWSGDLCDTVSPYDVEVISNTGNDSIVNSMIIVCIVLLVILVLFAIFLCHHIRLREDEIKGSHGQYVQSMLNDSGGAGGIVGNENSLLPVPLTAESTGVGLGGGGVNPLLEESSIVTTNVSPKKGVTDMPDDVVGNDRQDEDRVP